MPRYMLVLEVRAISLMVGSVPAAGDSINADRYMRGREEHTGVPSPTRYDTLL
jgi:hypothetical protein